MFLRAELNKASYKILWLRIGCANLNNKILLLSLSSSSSSTSSSLVAIAAVTEAQAAGVFTFYSEHTLLTGSKYAAYISRSASAFYCSVALVRFCTHMKCFKKWNFKSLHPDFFDVPYLRVLHAPAWAKNTLWPIFFCLSRFSLGTRHPRYPRSLLEHTAATLWTEIIIGTYCYNDRFGHYCCLRYYRCICSSIGCSADVIVIWYEEHLWYFGVLQRVHLSNPFYVVWCLQHPSFFSLQYKPKMLGLLLEIIS